MLEAFFVYIFEIMVRSKYKIIFISWGIYKIISRGISEETIDTLSNSGINIRKWLHGFDSVEDSIKESVELIKKHPLIPKDVKVHGLIMDPETGNLEVVIKDK